MAGLRRPEAITAGDFAFRIGNNDTPATWPVAPTPAKVDVRLLPDEFTHRITITWDSEVISNEWLQVTMLANLTTGLLDPDLFYWGNQIGETGNQVGDTAVNSSDLRATSQNSTGFTLAEIWNSYDANRDRAVSSSDLRTISQNATGFVSLVLFEP